MGSSSLHFGFDSQELFFVFMCIFNVFQNILEYSRIFQEILELACHGLINRAKNAKVRSQDETVRHPVK